MAGNLERDVAAHYGKGDLLGRLLDALKAGGSDIDNLTAKDLAPVDEFHIGGRPATAYAVGKMHLGKEDHVLDVGCGIGGAARYLASTIGCTVTGIDLTPEYIAAARDLTRRTNLGGKIGYHVASALAMPFGDAAFDAALTIHVAMNIKDRAGLYREIARVLKPGALLCIYDVMKGPADGLTYPVPWAESADTSHLTTPADMTALLQNAGFSVELTEDRKESAIAFFRDRVAPSGVPPSVGLHLLMSDAPVKFKNMLTNIEQDRISPVVMLARKQQPSHA